VEEGDGKGGYTSIRRHVGYIAYVKASISDQAPNASLSSSFDIFRCSTICVNRH
jgi:hypothetical protein